MAFRIQDLMMDVRPGGLQMANPECSCQVSARPEIQREPEIPADEPDLGPEEGPGIPDDDTVCVDMAPPSRGLEGLFLLRAQLRRDLGQSV